MQDIATTGPVIAGAAKFSLAFPLVYHYLGGVRHLAWDHFPDTMLSTIGVEKASFVLAGSSLVISAGLAFV